MTTVFVQFRKLYKENASKICGEIMVHFYPQVWRPYLVPVWVSSSGGCWLRSWTCLLWVLSVWPCWSTWCPLPVTSLFSSWAVTTDLSLGLLWPMPTSKSDNLVFSVFSGISTFNWLYYCLVTIFVNLFAVFKKHATVLFSYNIITFIISPVLLYINS